MDMWAPAVVHLHDDAVGGWAGVWGCLRLLSLHNQCRSHGAASLGA